MIPPTPLPLAEFGSVLKMFWLNGSNISDVYLLVSKDVTWRSLQTFFATSHRNPAALQNYKTVTLPPHKKKTRKGKKKE